MLVTLIFSIGILILLKSKLEWLLDALTTIAIVAWIFQSVNWSWVEDYLRIFLLALLIIALLFKVRTSPFRIKYIVSIKNLHLLYIHYLYLCLVLYFNC